MAKLAAPSGGSGLQIEHLAPPGQYLAVCILINDLFGQERTKFQSQEKELQDVTRFVFGVIAPDGRPYLIQTFEFKISGAPGSNLMAFLTSWVGQTPQMGWDYAEMLGRGAMITIQHKPSAKNPSKIYADITTISPVFPQMANQVPPASHFAQMLAQLQAAKPGAPANGAPPVARPPGAVYPPVLPPPPAPFVPPPVAPPPGAAEAKEFWVLINGQTHECTKTQMLRAPADAQVCKMSEAGAGWKPISAFRHVQPAAPIAPPAPPAPPAFAPPPAAPGSFTPPPPDALDEDVPF